MNLDTLPASGYLRIYMTATRVNFDEAPEGGDAESGWVDPSYSRSTLFESRNDVRPVVEVALPLDDDAREEIARTVAELGSFHTDDGSTLYAEDAVTLDYSTADVFLYALHAHVKHYDGPRGYVEDDVSIIREED